MKKCFLFLFPLLVSCSPKVNNQTEKLYDYNAFEFYIVWGLSRSSFDSETGELVKSRDYIEHKPEDFITNYNLLENERKMIFNKAVEIDIYSYKKNYNPYSEDDNGSPMVVPSAGLKYKDSYTSFEIPFYSNNKSYDPINEKGKALIGYFRLIIDIVTNTDEWKSLPGYEVYYD